MKTKLLVSFILLTSFCYSQTYILNDDFESETLGTQPSNWTQEYNGTGDTNQKIVDSPVMSGTKSFQMEGQGSWSSEFYHTPASLPEEVTIEAWINAEHNTLSGFTGSIGIGNFSVGSWGTRTSRLTFYGGNIVATYSSGNIYTIQPFNANQWYHIKLEHNLINKTYKVYIDGVLATGTYNGNSTTEFPMHPTVTSRDIMLMAGNSGTVKMFFDDIKVYKTNPDLVAHYPFDGNANDVSGNANHGTVNGAFLTNDRFGYADSAYSFDGLDDTIICLNPGPVGNSERTISFWAKTNEVPHSTWDNAVISYGSNTSYGNRFELSVNSRAQGFGIDINGAACTAGFDNSDNDWHFYTAVFNPNNGNTITDVLYYADGNLLTSFPYNNGNSSAINTASDLPIHIGSMFNTHRFYDGSIDDLKIFSKALTQEEILAEYLGNQNLVAYYPFNGNANDESGNANHGTVNSASLTNDRFGNADSAYSFNGNDSISIPHDDSLNIENELSLSLWVHLTTLPTSDKVLIGKSNYSTNTNYLLRLRGDGNLQFEYKIHSFIQSSELQLNQWNHIVCTSDGNGTVKMYVNGIDTTVSNQSNSPFGLVTHDLTIGARSIGGENFNGNIDDIRIFNKELTIAEVLALYNASLSIETIVEDTKANFFVANNVLYFKDSQNLNEVKSVQVYSLLGQQVFETSIIEQQISLNHLIKGIYILKVNTTKNHQTLKFITN